MLAYLIRAIARVVVRKDWMTVKNRISSIWTKLSQCPELTAPLIAQRLLISGEDHRHARHPGYDGYAICRAFWRRLTQRSREGASTIEQQVVRVITNRYENTVWRKVREIMLATLVAEYFPKEILPAVYLHIGYYGWRMTGYAQACIRLELQTNFLDLETAAGLVARLKYPEPKANSPQRLQQIERRQRHLLKLYRKHMLDGTYEHINDTFLGCRYPATQFIGTLP